MRTLNVVRLQYLNKNTFVWAPLMILGGAFAISYLIFVMVPGEGPKFSGASQAPLWYFAAVAVMALTKTFPFSQALSVTRREYYLGTLLAAVFAAFVLTLIFVGFGLLEKATDGFGLGGRMFYLEWIWVKGPLAAGFFYFTIAMFFFVVGYFFAVLYKRYGNLVMTAVILGVTLVLVALAGLATLAGAWPQVWAEILRMGALGLAGWLVLITVVLAAIGWFPMRRAIP